jgi:hypothetical protein
MDAEPSISVKVAVRVRPLTPQETGEGSQPAVLVQDELGSISVGSGTSSKSFSCVRRFASCAAPPVPLLNLPFFKPPSPPPPPTPPSSQL